MNVPVNGAAPSTPNMGDVWLTTNDNHMQFQDKNNATQAIAYLSDITSGTATTITGSIMESQVTNLPSDLNTLTASVSTETGRATTAENTISGNLTAETARATGAEGTLTTNLGNEVTRATNAETTLGTNVTAANAAITAETSRAEGAEITLGNSITSTATTTLNTAEAFSANASNISSGTIGQAFLPSDVVYNNQANAYTAGSKQTLGASATTAASLNVPNTGDAPSTPNMGDVWLTGADAHLQFQDKSNTAQSLAFLSDVNASNASVATEAARAEAAETTLTNNLTAEVTVRQRPRAR